MKNESLKRMGKSLIEERKETIYRKRNCTNNCMYYCSRLKDKQFRKKYPGHIGICEKYNQLVIDALCGYENKKDGTVVLWNFGGQE